MTYSRLSIAIIAIAIAAACADQTSATVQPPTSAPASAAAQTPAPGDKTLAGTVAETIDAGQYTYVRVRTASGDAWIAAPVMTLRTGERITAAIDMPMDNFHSKALNRDFAVLYFVSSVAREGESLPTAAAEPALVDSHSGASGAGTPQADQVAVAKNAPPAGGMSIADVWASRTSLSGKTVVVRGTVVKVNNEIMGRNWFHLQDGSGAADQGTHDLTVTSSATVRKGDVVTVSGVLAIDQDFGAGYAYKAMIEKATVSAK